jgi:transposase
VLRVESFPTDAGFTISGRLAAASVRSEAGPGSLSATARALALPSLNGPDRSSPLKDRLHDSRTFIMVNPSQFTRTPKLCLALSKKLQRHRQEGLGACRTLFAGKWGQIEQPWGRHCPSGKMAQRFKNIDPNIPLADPPDLRDWVAEDDLVHFVIHAVQRLPLSAFAVNYKRCGHRRYSPHVALALLIHCYANGIFSSRSIERATYRDIAVRYLTGNTHPDHDTTCACRRLRNRST